MNFSKKLIKRAALTATLVTALSLSACMNIFNPIDNPHGDEQTLSAARAAFDRGDLQEARDLYAKLGSNETALSETIFTKLEECGGGIEAVGAALGAAAGSSANSGILVTVMAEKMNTLHGATCLATLLAAYKSSQALTDPSLKGFTGFLAAMAVAGEVLAHSTKITSDGNLSKTDIVSNGVATACTIQPLSCGAGCAVSDGISAAATSGNLLSYTTITPTWGVFQDAINAANANLALLGISTGPSAVLTSGLGAAAPATDHLYRCALHDIGVGR